MEQEETGYGLVMPFLDGCESYAFGFEVGRIWELLEFDKQPEKMLVHAKNISQLELVAKHFRCDLYTDQTTDVEWCEVTFVKRPKPNLKLVHQS